ncbi:MAG: SDR family oxidoreductase [Actinobacteria bacterium]|nr:SDR family oxidoreductase [Actinomycetota bacterium]
MPLEGKVALVTGGGTGIGTAITERLVADGAKVCITGRRQELLDEVAGSLAAGCVMPCAGDVCKDEDAKRMVEAALAINGRIDILVNNAGIEAAGTVIQMDSSVWRQELEINLTGPFLMMKEALPYMIEAGGGCIVNISSLAGVRCVPGSPAYCATKAGLIHLTKQVALDYGKDKIRCNVICPGPIKTRMLDSVLTPMADALNTDLDDVYGRMPKNVPLRRVAMPSEVAGVVAFLAGDDSSFVTGTTIMVDGGTHIVDAFASTVSDFGVNWG